MTEEQEIELAVKGDEWASTRTADRGGYYFAGLSEGYYNGYIAGATENGIQWHDLRKDPNDLPKDRRTVVLVVSSCDYVRHKILASYRHKYWVNTFNYNKVGSQIIAWCEIPTFDKE